MTYSAEPLTVSQIAEVANAKIVFGSGDDIVDLISTDSRDCAGAMFIALTGERFDGNDFIESACDGGAKGYISSKDCVCTNCRFALRVENTNRALQQIASFYRQKFDINIIGLTGSVGKTTTKELVAAVLEKEKSVIKTQGNFNNEIGLPLTLFGIRKHHQVGVIEMGMSNFGEISRLTECAKPDVAIITNIGESHIENLKSREGILKAKCEIFEGLKPDGIAVLNGDDELLYGIKKDLPFDTIYCGIENASCDIVAGDIVSGSTGVSFTVDGKKYAINLAGRHNVMNALIAIAVGRIYGLSDKSIMEGLSGYESRGIRQSITEKDGIKVITDCYNAAPKSVKAAIDVLCDIAKGKKTAVLGDMAELGEQSPVYHRQIGEYAAKSGVDELVLIGKSAVFTSEGARAANTGCKVSIFDGNSDIIDYLESSLKSGDTVLFKGSRVMKMEEIAEKFN